MSNAEEPHTVSTSTSAPAGDRAYESVKQRILSGELPAGELISEGEIASALGVSRTPVREAFLRLQAEGWMRLYPKRGALIQPIARSEAREVLEARTLLETHAVQNVTRDAARTAALIATLREALRVQQRHADAGDTAGYAAADADFHVAIVEAGGNGLLAGFYAGLRDRQVRMVAHSVPVTPPGRERADAVIAQHGELLDAIGDGDAARFSAALQRHFDEVHRELLA